MLKCFHCTACKALVRCAHQIASHATTYAPKASRWASTTSIHTAEYEVLDSHLDMSFGALNDEAHLLKGSIALQMSVCILQKITYRISMFCSTYMSPASKGQGRTT